MSYSFDVLSRVWSHLEDQLPPEVKASEVCTRFGFLLQELHEANHRLKDAVNHDPRVTKFARKLDEVYSADRAQGH